MLFKVIRVNIENPNGLLSIIQLGFSLFVCFVVV